MTTRHRNIKQAMCRGCGHDLYVVRQGKDQGQVRCSNRSCKWAARNYKMGKVVNAGPVAA